MNRPPRPRMMHNVYRSPRPYQQQWRPNHALPGQFPWRSTFGAHNTRPESSEDHWCETCDRGFPTAELLYKHKQQHQKCNIDGCQFVAHPKVITKHIQMQHSTGLYKKIANLNNPEEIQRWRDERKKKYPTKSNIEKKEAEYKEKLERGEKMALKCDYRNDKHKSAGNRLGGKRRHSFNNKNQNHRINRPNIKTNTSISTIATDPPPKKSRKILPSTPNVAEKNKLKPFTGILNIDMDDKAENTTETSDNDRSGNDLIEDDDFDEVQELPKEIINNAEPVMCGALTSLMCDYGTSDEETEEKENEILNNINAAQKEKIVEPVDVKIESALVKITENIENTANESDDDGPVEVKIVKTSVDHDDQEPATKNIEKPGPVKKIKIPRTQQNHNYKFKKHKIPSSLLQKLLHREIRHERNIVLQCIRYIKTNNYFDKQ